ncbi:MAG: NfeD family protein [Halobacteriaceae archaeon]
MPPEVLGLALPLFLTILGIALIVAEAMAPGAHFIVLGVALLGAGLIGLLVPPLAQPLVAAGLVVAVGAMSLYVYRTFDFYGGKGIARTSDSETLVGQRGVVTERVTPQRGRVELRDGGFDPTFSARSVDGEIAAGTEIIVVDPGGGSVLTVESVESLDDIDRELAREQDGNDTNA